ncbi:AAA family ATPase [Flammeovirga yaeyamensis]|uniref:AAA family ATPase n=1 Tax=Flammeovirga yaeyamensis TaxID=367791 RepID=A0AAX1NCK1_9BACT|nr:AAA family ATPase [Flammeovirga yaeyamensis]MBB3696864.1 Cdc6-like AAA superfamily ATPase [Flammeovirga yaeyamensis]QWG05200.1 AAA family ATPase [Flammeovirga yaeyamensis]
MQDTEYSIINEFVKDIESNTFKVAPNIKKLIKRDNFLNNIYRLDKFFFENKFAYITIDNFMEVISKIKQIHGIKNKVYNDFNIWSKNKSYLKRQQIWDEKIAFKKNQLQKDLGFIDGGNGIYKSFLGNDNLISYLQYKFSSIDQIQKKEMNYPLNTILYGPPGTGKTYSTISRAASIISSEEIEDYNEAKRIFNKHKGDQIEFITFHQNYSYEDFIQGLRPDTGKENQLSFEKKDGIFKKIANRALENLKDSEKTIEEYSKGQAFEEALKLFCDKITDRDEETLFDITDNVAIIEVENDAFRYNGMNWNNSNGHRMKFDDLRILYKNNIKERKSIKRLDNVSGSAKQHATYYNNVYQEIIKYLPKNTISKVTKVEKKNYVIIIDEINRANISRVFGELITLIEPDKRYGEELALSSTLPSGDEFTVPSNLYIIGTMNTADKSIALLDIALRRRFEFESLYTKYDIDGINESEILKSINEKIIKMKGHDFQIGHSYFMSKPFDLKKTINNKVIPLLLEYFLNDEKEVKEILVHAGFEVDAEAWPLKIK